MLTTTRKPNLKRYTFRSFYILRANTRWNAIRVKIHRDQVCSLFPTVFHSWARFDEWIFENLANHGDAKVRAKYFAQFQLSARNSSSTLIDEDVAASMTRNSIEFDYFRGAEGADEWRTTFAKLWTALESVLCGRVSGNGTWKWILAAAASPCGATSSSPYLTRMFYLAREKAREREREKLLSETQVDENEILQTRCNFFITRRRTHARKYVRGTRCGLSARISTTSRL